MDGTSRRRAPAPRASPRWLGVFAAIITLGAAAAHADDRPPDEFAPGFRLKLTFHANEFGVVGGGDRYVDLLKSTADFDLERLAGMRGADAHIELVHNYGARPRDLAGSLQRTNDEDVETRRFRLYQAWFEQGFAGGRASMLAGVYDFKHEFAELDAAGALINPSFGISPEMSRAGPDQAPTFPSSALAARVRWRPAGRVYLQMAVENAHAGTVGDAGGLDTSFRTGVLLLGEAGVASPSLGKVAVGLWGYSHELPDLRDRTAQGTPLPRAAHGAYAMIETPLSTSGAGLRAASIFGRASLSDGDTTPFAGSWQAGLRVRRLFDSRPDSVLSLGVTQSFVSGKFRDVRAMSGRFTQPVETTVELTYADKVNRFFTLQPDLQWVHHPALNRVAGDACVLSLRMAFEL